jgi:hypothetical protein
MFRVSSNSPRTLCPATSGPAVSTITGLPIRPAPKSSLSARELPVASRVISLLSRETMQTSDYQLSAEKTSSAIRCRMNSPRAPIAN